MAKAGVNEHEHLSRHLRAIQQWQTLPTANSSMVQMLFSIYRANPSLVPGRASQCRRRQRLPQDRRKQAVPNPIVDPDPVYRSTPRRGMGTSSNNKNKTTCSWIKPIHLGPYRSTLFPIQSSAPLWCKGSSLILGKITSASFWVCKYCKASCLTSPKSFPSFHYISWLGLVDDLSFT